MVNGWWDRNKHNLAKKPWIYKRFSAFHHLTFCGKMHLDVHHGCNNFIATYPAPPGERSVSPEHINEVYEVDREAMTPRSPPSLFTLLPSSVINLVLIL